MEHGLFPLYFNSIFIIGLVCVCVTYLCGPEFTEHRILNILMSEVLIYAVKDFLSEILVNLRKIRAKK